MRSQRTNPRSNENPDGPKEINNISKGKEGEEKAISQKHQEPAAASLKVFWRQQQRTPNPHPTTNRRGFQTPRPSLTRCRVLPCRPPHHTSSSAGPAQDRSSLPVHQTSILPPPLKPLGETPFLNDLPIKLCMVGITPSPYRARILQICTLLYLKWITNKGLLYGPGDSAQCYVAAWMGGEFGREFSSVQFSRSVVSDSLQPHGLQHARFPGTSPTPRIY